MFFTNSKLEKLVDDIFENNTSMLSPMFNSTIIKKYYDLPTIVRDENGIEIELTLAGYEREDLEISIEGDILTIQTIEDFESDIVDSFSRSFELTKGLETSKCEAEMRAGILKIKFKNKSKKIKKVKIN